MKPICFSGGATGADHTWGLMASDCGHSLIHYSFPGHNSVDPKYTKKLSRVELDEADNYVEIAAKNMKRRWPTNNPKVNDLLRRNYFQIRSSDRIYAVANFLPDDKSKLKISGGTCWAAQMYVDRWYADRNLKECELYFFDMTRNKWMQWWETWIDIDRPPTPRGRYAGIGSRDITDDGIKAIFTVYG